MPLDPDDLSRLTDAELEQLASTFATGDEEPDFPDAMAVVAEMERRVLVVLTETYGPERAEDEYLKLLLLEQAALEREARERN